METLEGRVALITGGTGALGSALVARMLNAGVRVHVPWISRREVERLRAELDEGIQENLTVHQTDLTDPQAVDELFAAIRQQERRLDILANVAGSFFWASVADTEPEDWNRMLAHNATTAFLCSRAAIPLMREQRFGRILNVTAMPALHGGAAQMTAYSASKAALLNLTQSLAKELAGTGITANAIVPNIVDTPPNREALPKADTSLWLSPESVADVMTFLFTDAARIVTGSAIELAVV